MNDYFSNIVTYSDYYPFGMVMPNRNGGDFYRHSFNGMEKDDEIKGNGNHMDFGARAYDSRLGRFMSIDPKEFEYPFLSPYNFVANNPVLFIDKNGEDIWIVGKINGKKTKVQFVAGQPVPDKAGKFLKEAYTSFQKAINDGDEGVTELSKNDDVDIKVKYYHGRKGSHYNPNTQTVKWDNRMGIFAVFLSNPADLENTDYNIYPQDERTIFSPYRLMLHEMRHGYNHLILGDIFKVRNSGTVSSPAYTNPEEERVIKRVDFFNLKVRLNHKGVRFEAEGLYSEEGIVDLDYLKGSKVPVIFDSNKDKHNLFIHQNQRLPLSLFFLNLRLSPKENHETYPNYRPTPSSRKSSRKEPLLIESPRL